MPNTLVHIAIQSPASRIVARDTDPKWIYAACILPDVPWIVQRAVGTLAPAVDPVQLRYYVDAQGSLLGTLVLCAAISLCTRTTVQTFALLGANAVLHLALDALEIKWANGVHLLAPFSWEYINIGLVWPEDPVILVLTLAGVLVLLVQARESVRRPIGLLVPPAPRIAAAVALLLIYLIAPLFLMDGPHEADNHSLKSLSQAEDRTGLYVEFDRARLVKGTEADYIVGITRDSVLVEGTLSAVPASVSVRGVFISDDVLRVTDFRIHPIGLRDALSIVGLAGVALIWAVSIGRVRSSLRNPS